MHEHTHEQEHEHGSSHTHDHGPDHAPERQHVPERGAVLDIGGDVGAVLVQSVADLDGAEIELYDEAGSYVMHTEVHGRDVFGSRQYAGLFPAVQEGTYLLDLREGSPRRRVVVTGGQVTMVNAVSVSSGR
jgi:hypothetical protein